MIKTNNSPVDCADSDCTNKFTKFKSTDKYCSYTCAIKNKKTSVPKTIKRIKPISDKQKKLLAEYYKIRADFMNLPENKKCPVTGKATTDVHHKKGKIGFADEWARINNIPLLLDTRFFLAVSRAGHTEIELNPVWAKENGFSVNRLDS